MSSETEPTELGGDNPEKNNDTTEPENLEVVEVVPGYSSFDDFVNVSLSILISSNVIWPKNTRRSRLIVVNSYYFLFYLFINSSIYYCSLI